MGFYMEHANVTVRSADEAMTFLKLVFPEFEIRGQGESETKRWIHFGTDKTYIALEEMVSHTTSGRQPYRDDGINHVGWVVEDLEGIREKTIAAGYRTGDLMLEGDGPQRKRVYIFDSVGNEWEFVEYLSENPLEKNVYEKE